MADQTAAMGRQNIKGAEKVLASAIHDSVHESSDTGDDRGSLACSVTQERVHVLSTKE
jgi:hypothetical protein